MISRNTFRKRMDDATRLMRGGDIDESGRLLTILYKSLHLETYKQRLALRRFDRVFFGLDPEDVFTLLYDVIRWQLNTCKTHEAISTIRYYHRIEKDFSISGPLDYWIGKIEIDAYRRLGENAKALCVCEKLLEWSLASWQKAEILIMKGSIESDESHLVFGINSLSLALGEAEADGTPTLIAKCYLEMAKMLGSHYPALNLSFLWKARVFYEKIQDDENVAFCKSRMAMEYFLLWHKGNKKDNKRFIEEARRLVNEDIKRECFRHLAAQYSFDRQKGLINNDIGLIESAMTFFKSINAYGDYCLSAEFYIKTALTIGDREAAKRCVQQYEQVASERNDQRRLSFIRGIDCDKGVACWVPQEYKKLPNLLDVLEMLAYDEEWFHLEKGVMRLLFPTHYQEGMFETVLMPDGKTHLYPCTLYPYRYYRGQSDKLEGKKCNPSIYRGLTKEEAFHERLCLKEFEILLKEYPLTKIYDNGLAYYTPEGVIPLFLKVDANALGQHYGIKTDLLDLTADKWVAAFFASTEYVDGKYVPYKKDGEGAVYVYNYMPADNAALNRMNAVGLQPFSRPGCQAGLVCRMNEDEDFNDMARRIIFKQDPDISNFIYSYCNRSKKLFPDEILEEKVAAIKESKSYSRKAYINTIGEYYQNCSEDEIMGYLKALKIDLMDTPPVTFSENELNAFDERWNKEMDHFFDSVNVRLMYSAPKDK